MPPRSNPKPMKHRRRVDSANGLIFDVKRYAIHDGPGIRTTVFFKGCPLSCRWCHNPEGLLFSKELTVWPNRCIECLICTSACANSAISTSNSTVVTDRDRCRVCGICAEKCPANAREIMGKEVAVNDLMQEVEKDLPFYEGSGGITVSGGEPLSQPAFLHALLSKCKKKGIHTTVDTSGYAEKKTLTKISQNVDLFLYDLKVMDNKKHMLYTGVSNEQIVENLKLLNTLGKKMIIRFPLIPSVNSHKDNIRSMCELISELKNVERIDVLPYHRLGAEKAKRLGKDAKIFEKPSDELVSQSLRRIESYGLAAKIGG